MKRMRCSFLWPLFALGLLLPGRLAASIVYGAPIPGENDRIGWSADGNRHDPDDWGATAMALAIFAKQGWQNKLVHIDYNNWLPDNTPYKSAEETISVVEGARKFRFTRTKIFDCQTDLEAAVDNVVAEINKSSSDSRFWYVQAGPFEVAYLSLLKADPDKRKYCILVSHSAANDRPQHWPGQHGKDDCVALGAKYFFTTGQGKQKFGSRRFHQWQLVDWMKNSPNPEYRWVYSRLKKTAEHKDGCLDASDGGMAFVLATGDTDGNFSPKLRDFLGTGWAGPGGRVASVGYDAHIPQLAFAAQELEGALEEAGREGLQVMLVVRPDESSPESFQIRSVGSNRLEVAGSDATGAMYGGLEVAELIRLGLPIKDQDQKPFVGKRGIKINIPLDIRTPSFDDSGEAAQKNIKTMWDFEFWKEYLDDLARYRYNVVSLWAAHPFPSMIKLEEYPDIAMDDVYYSKGALDTTHLDAAVCLDDDKEGSLNLGKKILIDEKIRYWQQVFQYAQDRGIEIIMVHWNLHMHGAAGKYGITQEQDNPTTIEYIRACVRQMLLTYPQITGIGVCAGENDDRYLRDEFMTEKFVFNSYGRAVMDVKELQPEREIRFIIRRHSTEYADFTDAFKDYTGGTIETSVKYAVAHMYSSRRPQEWEKRIVDEGWLEKYKVWLNVRNDDIFMHRWGSPDFAREFIRWMPHQHSPGFYMGSDTYVWGREFISKNPETAGRLEIDKHWYRFRLWGQLAYNIELGDDYWEAALKHRFPGVDARLLLEAWESVSEVVPQLNRSVWSPTDGSFAAEGCRRTSGFLTLDGYHFERPAMVLNRIENAPDPQCITVTDWAKAFLSGKELEGLAPPEIAENLDDYAAVALEALPTLRAQMGDNVELKETLNDIESMAYLGRYYADKMRGAAKLALYREGGRQDSEYLEQSVVHLKDAVEKWKAYAAVLTPQYKTQIGARANSMDWNSTLKYVEEEVETIKEEGDYPKLRFVNLADGAHLSEGSDLRVELEATDGNGVPKVRLRLNGLVINAEEKLGDLFVWSGSSENLLKSLDAGMYHLEAVAVDKNGLRTSEEIDIKVGNASQSRTGDWKDKIHQVILNEGETFSNGDTRNFPQLECFLSLADDGSLALNSGTPGNSEGRIWGTNGKANRPKPHPVPFRFYIALDNGQLRIHREKPGRPKVIIYETRSVSGPGPFKLGITASRRLAIFSEVEGIRKIIWRSPVQN